MSPLNPTCEARRPVRRATHVGGVLSALLLALTACTTGPDPDPTAAPSTSVGSSSAEVPDPTEEVTSTTAEPTPLRLGLVATSVEGSAGEEISTSIAVEVEAAGAVLVACDPGQDGAQMLGCLRRMTAQEVDGWILLPTVDVTGYLCDDEAQTLPFITIGRPTGCERAVAGPDEVAVGRSVGAALGARASSGAGCPDSVLLIVADSAASWADDRIDGITAGYAGSCPDAEPIVLEANGQEQAYSVVGTALAALPPEIEVLLAAADDSLGLGALAAVPETRADQVLLASVGADRQARCTMRADRRWIGDAALWPDRYGEVVVPALLDAIAGGTVPDRLPVPSEFLDADVLDVFYPSTECPAS